MPIDEDPAFAIIIPHYNDVARLRTCLDALAVNDLDHVEVVVVDNGSSQDLAAVKQAFAAIRFCTEAQTGAACARNRGVSQTTAPYLFFLDSDCVPAPDWVATARDAVTGHDVTGGRINVFDETAGPRTGAQAFEAVFGFDQRQYIEQKGFSVTANLLTTRRVFDDVGPFKTGVSEDFDWCMRARQKGYDLVYDDALVVAHPSRGNWSALVRKWRRLTAEGFGLIRNETAGRPQWAARALLMPLSAVAHVPKVLRCSKLSMGEKMRGVTTLLALRIARMVWMLRQAVTGRA